MRSRQQGGFALLVTLLVLITGATTIYVLARQPEAGRLAARSSTDAATIARARSVVLARAATDANRPGSLSCPDLDGDGSADTSTCSDLLGRFPHRTHAVERLRDGSGSAAWYAIAPGLLDEFAPLGTATVNPSTVTPFEVNGQHGYGAVILAPGPVRAGQDRRPANRNNADHYLDDAGTGTAANNNGPPFIDCVDHETCNDRVRGITVSELFDIPQQRVLAAVETMLAEFHATHGYLPYAAPFGSDECDGPPAKRTVGQLPFADTDGDCGGLVLDREDDPTDTEWVKGNEWFGFVVYRVDEDCAGAGAACGPGSLQLGTTNGLQAVVAVAGRELDAPAHDPDYEQDRTGAPTITDYLDSAENTNGDTAFDDHPPRRNDNDNLKGIIVNE